MTDTPKSGILADLAVAAISLPLVWLWLWLAVNNDPSSLFGLIEPARSMVTRSLVFDLVVFGGLGLFGISLCLGRGLTPAPAGNDPLVALLWGLACGFGGMAALFAVIFLAGHAETGGSAWAAGSAPLIGVAAVLVQAGGEELFFRGWLLRVLTRNLGGAGAVMLAALAFGLLHLVAGWEGPVALINMMLGGAWFGLLALRTGGLLAPVMAHFAWNATEAHVLGLVPNPGVTTYGSMLDYDIAGSPMWGGGDAGLNTSPIQSAVLVLLILATFALRRGSDAGATARP